MKGISKKTVWQTAVFIFFIVIAGTVLYFQQKEISLLRKKTEINAKEIEALKIDLNTNKEGQLYRSGELPQKNTDLLFLQRKMTEMKKEVERMKKDNDSEALNEYKKKEEQSWDEHTENVKKLWSGNLKEKLIKQNFNEEEVEEVLYNYSDMIDKMKVYSLSWYREEMSDEEINKVSVQYAKDFYDNASSSIGEQKASIVLGIVFPDPSFRKSLFSVE
jgi:hypothetical protein